MTKEQEVMLKKNASKIVCLDSTHETNQYKFKLVTVLVPDEFGKGLLIMITYSIYRYYLFIYWYRIPVL